MHDQTAAVTIEQVNAFLSQSWVGSQNRCIEIGARFAIASLEIAETQIRPGGLISGPTQFGLCDAVMWFAIFGAIGIEPMAVTSELSIRFLRPCVGTTLFARCDLLTVGRRTIVGEMRAWSASSEKPSAVAQGTYLRPT